MELSLLIFFLARTSHHILEIRGGCIILLLCPDLLEWVQSLKRLIMGKKCSFLVEKERK